MTAGELIARILAVTPSPPEDADLDQVVATATAMAHAREVVLAGATAPPITTPAEAEQLAVLETRQRAWDTLLAAALCRIAQQRAGATKVRAYAQTLAAGCR